VKRSNVAFFAAGYLIASRGRGAPRGPSTIALTGVPDRRRRAQDGIVAEAAIVARVLRLRILTLDATVAFTPAVVTAASAGPSRPAVLSSGAALPAAGRSTEVVGRRLADAIRSIDEGAAMLARARETAGFDA
jgi:hypothetical protein